MAHKRPERRQGHTLDERSRGSARGPLSEGVPVDELPLRETDAERVSELRGGAKGKLLAAADFITEKAAKTALSLEQVERWLGGFKARFDDTLYLHEGVLWADVERALHADPDAMRAFAELDQNGHETNVFGEDAKTFEIGTCSLEAASGHRNIVFDKEAQDLLGEDEQCNGNAVDLTETIGVDLMDEDQANSLIRKLRKNKQRVNQNSWDWLKTDEATRKRGLALYVFNDGVREDVADNHFASGSFRAVRRVKKLGL